MDVIDTPITRYFLSHINLLLWRDYLQEILTIPERVVCSYDRDRETSTLMRETPVYAGKLVLLKEDDAVFSSVVSFVKNKANDWDVTLTPTDIPVLIDTPLLSPKDKILLQRGVVANYNEADPLETSVGRVILNHLVLSDPFGDKIPYMNTIWKASDLEKIIGNKIILEEVSVDEVNTYIRNAYFIGHAPELCVPNLSEKSLTTDPRVAEVKAALMKQYGAQIASGDAVAMSTVEQTLIQMDKDYLKGDSSMGYYISKKSFDIHRKKLLLTNGMLETFGQEGTFTFMENSLEEGWTVQNFPQIANDIRLGTYARSTETAKGGEMSKFLARIFQEVRVVEEDCHTTRGLDVFFHKGNIEDYIHRYRITDQGVDLITDENASTLLSKTEKIRSPLYCTSERGYCFTCMGKLVKTIDKGSLATASTAIGAQTVVGSLKKSHGSVHSVVSITSLNPYIA